MATIVEVYLYENNAVFECRLQDFISNVNMTSPTYFGVTCKVFKKDRNSCNFTVQLSRELVEAFPASIRYTIRLKITDESARMFLLCDNIFHNNLKQTECVLTLYPYLCQFNRQYPPVRKPGKIIVSLMTWPYAHSKTSVSAATQTEIKLGTNDGNSGSLHLDWEDLTILSDNLKDLLNSGEDHDAVVVVKDKHFKAHKNMIRARSPVFAAMFRSDMRESASGTIKIDDCDPDAFGEFLQYLYTGRADISSVKVALGLYYAGDKYDVPRLKEMSVGFLKVSLSTTVISDVVTLAARHGEEELLQLAISYFSENLEKILMTVEWQRFNSSNPTQANEMTLKAVQRLNTTRRE